MTINIEYKTRRVWKYQGGNQNPSIEEEHTTQWPKEKVQKDKQRSIKHTYKTKDQVTRTPLKIKFDETKAVIRRRKSKDRQCKGQRKKDKQWSTKH